MMRDRGDHEAGFTLLEVVCVLAIVGLLAAVLLPNIPRQTSRPRLEAYAIETAALLKSDRNAAIRRGLTRTTRSLPSRRISPSSSAVSSLACNSSGSSDTSSRKLSLIHI